LAAKKTIKNKHKMKNWTIPTLIVLAVIVISFINYELSNELEVKSTFYKSKLGEQYILEKDTLTIVDYNFFKEVFILSNGKEINKNLVNQ
jgi:hypothetical protein